MRNIWRVSILLCLMGFIVSGSLLAQSDLGTKGPFWGDDCQCKSQHPKQSRRGAHG